MQTLFYILAVLSLASCLRKVQKHTKKMNPEDTVKLPVHQTAKQALSQKMGNKKGDSIFQQDRLGRDKSGEAHVTRLSFQVSHEGEEVLNVGEFQNSPAIINSENVYFTENDMSYRSIISGFEIARIVPAGLSGNIQDYHRITTNIRPIKQTVLTDYHYKGYCFKILLPSEKWLLCHQCRKTLEHVRNKIRVKSIMQYLHTRKI